jgi:hypothetical protein
LDVGYFFNFVSFGIATTLLARVGLGSWSSSSDVVLLVDDTSRLRLGAGDLRLFCVFGGVLDRRLRRGLRDRDRLELYPSSSCEREDPGLFGDLGGA